MSPQFNGTNGLPARGLCRWIASAQTYLPVPLSPEINTVAIEEAAAAMIR